LKSRDGSEFGSRIKNQFNPKLKSLYFGCGGGSYFDTILQVDQNAQHYRSRAIANSLRSNEVKELIRSV